MTTGPRNLERPRYEVDGKFQRAIRLAKKQGDGKQHLGIVYDHAWTVNFWFDDFDELTSLYDQVEKLAIDSDSADDIERITNLLPLLQSAVANGQLAADEARLDDRVARARSALETMGRDTARPNNAYHAQSLALLLRVSEACTAGYEPAVLDDLWAKFEKLIKKVQGLATFPFEPIAEALTEIGEAINSPAFDNLYEVLTDALVTRRSEGEAAKRNSQRGFQKLKMKLPYEAIRWFGRAVGLLTKHEYRDELIEGLIGSSFAYQEAGLHWAARNYAVAAASQEFETFRRTGSLDEVNPATLSRWMVTELSLGRIPYVLASHEITAIVRSNRSISDEQRTLADERLFQSTMWVGALLLRTQFDDLQKLSRFPDTLDRLGLSQGRVGLLYLMGELDALREEGSIPENETDAGVEEFFQQWSAFSRKMSLPDRPDYMLSDRVELRSRVLGCELTLSCDNNLTSISIGEALLGTIEALLATSLPFLIMPALDRLTVQIDPLPGTELTPTIEFSEDGINVGRITHRPELRYASYEEARTFPHWLQTAAIETFTRFSVPVDIEKWGKEVLEGERAFSRALTFSNIPNMMSLLLGNPIRLSMSDWEKETDRSYEVRRTKPWSGEKLGSKKDGIAKPRQFGSGPPPPGMFEFEKLKHSDLRIFSPIDIRKWDAAGWRGVFFLTCPGDLSFPPVMGIAFSNMEAGEAIFRGLRGRFGPKDVNEELRVAIFRGARISNPHAYGVSIGANLEKLPSRPGEIVQFGSRNHILTPSSSENLNRFLEAYREHGLYRLVPAKFNGISASPEPNMNLSIDKHRLDVREAWLIGPNDPDASILDKEDPPVLPMDHSDPPALRALEWIESLRKRRTGG